MKNSIEALKKKIEEFHYWDARVVDLKCDYFGDEITLEYKDDGENVIYKFEGCYKVHFNHSKGYNKLKPVKDMTAAQIPYFLQNVELSVVTDEEIDFFSCKIEMFPLLLEILCKTIIVEKGEKFIFQ